MIQKKIAFNLLIIFELMVLIILIYWHLKLGLVRLFDADEFAHLHWGYSLLAGEKPYTEFFYLFPPFFLYPVAAILKIFGRSIQAIIAARIFIFLTFTVTSGILFLLVKKLRGFNTALLSVIFFAFLPLPFDKLIEIRPDLLATGLALLGLLLFVKGDQPASAGGKYFFLSGVTYAASLGFVPKTVFFLVPVSVVFLISYLSNLGHLGRAKKDWLYFFLGFLPVGVVLLAILFSSGNPALALYSMTKMASSVTAVLGSKFYMRPDIFFYPNDTFYGFAGWSVPLWVNLIIYVSASVWAIHKMLTFNIDKDKRYGDKRYEEKGSIGEFLIAGSFWANLSAFVFFYPLKHSQYLIPVAPFVAFYAADLWESISGKLLKSPRLPKEGATILLLFLLVWVGLQMNEKKIQWTNKATLDKVSYFLQTIPTNEPVYDLTGESIFFKNGYYFCCLPYGQYEEALYFKLPDIEKELGKRGTNYVHVGWAARLNEIPAKHANYIRENFESISPDGMLLKEKTP